MGKFKGKPSRQNSRSPGAGARGGGSYAPGGDKSLIPRVQEFAEDGGDPSDVAATVEHLRGVYREYLRKPANVFRKMVERACEEDLRRRMLGSDATPTRGRMRHVEAIIDSDHSCLIVTLTPNT